MEQGSGYLLIASSSSHFFNKTDLEQYVLKHGYPFSCPFYLFVVSSRKNEKLEKYQNKSRTESGQRNWIRKICWDSLVKTSIFLFLTRLSITHFFIRTICKNTKLIFAEN